MNVFWGHSLQALHFILVVAVAFLAITKYSIILGIFGFLVIVGILIFGDCWLTILSNKCFKGAKHYKNFAEWWNAEIFRGKSLIGNITLVVTLCISAGIGYLLLPKVF